MMNKARKAYAEDGTCPDWCGPAAWQQLLAYFASTDYKELSEQAKKNRASKKGGVLHTSGRVPHSEILMQAVYVLSFLL